MKNLTIYILALALTGEIIAAEQAIQQPALFSKGPIVLPQQQQVTEQQAVAQKPLLPPPAILQVNPTPQQEEPKPVRMALFDTQQVYALFRKEIDDLMTRITALEKQIEMLMRSGVQNTAPGKLTATTKERKITDEELKNILKK